MDSQMSSHHPFVILAMPRVGTHFLEELLNEHPNVYSRGELLNQYEGNWPDKSRLLLSDRGLLEVAYLQYTAKSVKAEVTHVGCKINEPQFRDRPGIFDELVAWPGLKVILMVRVNVLESLRSLVQARQSGRWLKFSSDGGGALPPRVRLSTADCEAYFRLSDCFNARVVHSFGSGAVMVVRYEDVTRDRNACVNSVWSFLGVRPHQPSGLTDLQRQEMRPLIETVQNFDELRRYFSGGPYQKFFQSRDTR
ncbi:sulfotransferase domain-containing protein [Methylobacterium sp. WSM2598]|uniref:sulfotransferase domain-containing protein n=1 Tax=Methylobacterium sp. WSM2598 TaxID=398261 RepID=UPI00068537BD|nr:sulfotransferase domain-containing protein [Methylobacterium sp. WSM2598]